MRSIRMVETWQVFATLATLLLLACAEPPSSTQSSPTRTSSPDLGVPAPGIPTPGIPKKGILTYVPSLGAPNNEATLAWAKGHTVPVADPVTWSAMTTADFAQYKA